MTQYSNKFLCFHMLGKYGRLGNQMFQYASLKGIAYKNGYKFLIPKGSHSLSCFELPFDEIETEKITEHFDKEYVEPDGNLCFEQGLFKIPDGVSLTGYFQNTQYFSHIEQEIRKDFSFKEEIISEARASLEKFCKNGQTPVSVHVRRGDYLQFPDVFPIPSLQYYQKAMQKIRETVENPLFLFFTDDKIWVQQNFEKYPLSNNDRADLDLCMMAMCKHHIMCNSSFSWWGAWLAKSDEQIVIRPKNWFGQKGPKVDEHMLLKEWEVLDVA
jgi:hypothetical protein